MPEKRISSFTAGFMITVAVFFDGIQFLLNLIPLIGTASAEVLGIIAWLIFYIWFKMKGVSFSDTKKSAALLLGGIVELMPVLSALPAWTLSTVLIIALTRAEDMVAIKKGVFSKEKVKKQVLAQKARQRAERQRQQQIASVMASQNQQEQVPILETERQRVPLQNLSFKNTPVAANDNIYEQKKAA